MRAIEVQGHRGAMGLAPENTLPSFEMALDVGVTSIETDVHLTRDDIPVLCHEPRVGENGALVRSQTLAQLRSHRVAGPAHPPTPLADRFARERGLDPHGIPTLAELFDFVAAYAGPLGASVGKTAAQRQQASRVIFDLESKRFPFHPETIDDGFNGSAPGSLERLIVAAICEAGALARTRMRSFDHRSVRAAKQLEPGLQTAVLIYYTVPTSIAGLLEFADVYCPDYVFVDAEVVHQVHDAGKQIMPYTVNEASAWERLIAWGVDGVTTDYPDLLAEWLGQRSPSASGDDNIDSTSKLSHRGDASWPRRKS